MRAGVAPLLAAALFGAAAHAGTAPLAADPAAIPFEGTWGFEDTGDHQPADCYVSLLTMGMNGFYEFRPGPYCKSAYPVLAAAAYWRPADGGIAVFDAAKKPLIALPPETDHPEALYGAAPDGVAYRMERPFPPDFAGAYELWTSQSDYRGCRFHLGDDPQRYGFGATFPKLCYERHDLPRLVGWRLKGRGENGIILAFVDADGRETGAFEQAEGAEDALYGTIAGKAYKIAKSPD